MDRQPLKYETLRVRSGQVGNVDDNLVENLLLVKASISFRPLRRADFPLLQEWLSAPHVAAWWNERLDLSSVEAKYGPRVDGSEPTHVFVIEQEVRPIGWIQWYLWSDYSDHAGKLGAEPGSAGIDFAIGELCMTGLGLGPTAIRQFVRQVVFSTSDVGSVVSDPQENNNRSLRAFEKAGFKVVRTVQLTGEAYRRRVVRLDRPHVADLREYELRAVHSDADWSTYHRIRRTVLFESRGQFGVYNENNPDNRKEGNFPLLLAFRGVFVGVVRLDCGSGDVGVIRQLAIDGPAQGAGHCRVLLELLVARGIALGFRALEVNSDKQAVGFYQRFGFNLVQGERKYPLMQLSIR